MSDDQDGKLRLLSLDGGGVRSLSTLIILQQLLLTIDDTSPPKPCEIFDMIGGTCTGGLIAIMLGRLQMTVQECIDAFLDISHEVFNERRNRFFIKRKSSPRRRKVEVDALERAVKKILGQREVAEDTLLCESPNPRCKVFVCAKSKQNCETVCFTSYRPPQRRVRLPDSTRIWEACRATMAAAPFSEPISIGPYGEEFIDDSLEAKNPVYTLWNQAQDFWGADKLKEQFECLVSIGTGIQVQKKPVRYGVFHIGKSNGDIVSQAEATAEQFIRDKFALDDEERYYRFNVGQGFGDIGPREPKKVKRIAAATKHYIGSHEICRKMKRFTKHASRQGRLRTMTSGQTTFDIEEASLMSSSSVDLFILTSAALETVVWADDVLQSCQRSAMRLEINDVSTAALQIVSTTVRDGLSHIKSIITHDGDVALEDRFAEYILQEYDIKLQLCCLNFTILKALLEKMGFPQIEGMDKATLIGKLDSARNNRKLDLVGQNITRLARNINVLLAAFQSETARKASNPIRSTEETNGIPARISSDAVPVQNS